MANEEHLKILREGVQKWNQWRSDHQDIQPDLSNALLGSAFLRDADFRGVNLQGADLSEANLTGTSCQFTDFVAAELRDANLDGANLTGARLRSANLSFSNFTRATLFNANLSKAFLGGVNFSAASLDGADFSDTCCLATIFADTDLSAVKGLQTVEHQGPSSIGIDTLYQSQGKIPDEFLRGAGVPEEIITNLLPSIRSGPAIQFHSCFISYSGKDEEFAKRLHERMRAAKLRVWFAPEDMKGGDKLHEQLERAIQLHDRLLIVLSDHSILSPWVEREIRHAYETERKEGRRKLFPIRLTDMSTFSEWKCADSKSGKDLAEEVRQYFIPDFSNWKNHDAFEKSFAKLLADLKSGEKKLGASSP